MNKFKEEYSIPDAEMANGAFSSKFIGLSIQLVAKVLYDILIELRKNGNRMSYVDEFSEMNEEQVKGYLDREMKKRNDSKTLLYEIYEDGLLGKKWNKRIKEHLDREK
jgi:hypothetical protein